MDGTLDDDDDDDDGKEIPDPHGRATKDAAPLKETKASQEESARKGCGC